MASTLGRLFSWLSGSVPGDNTPPEMRADSVEVVAPAPMPQVPQGSQSVLHADVTESWLGSNPGPAALTSTPSWLNAQQTRAVLVNSGLMHRIVWVIPEDALSDGWKTEDESAEDEGEEREDITSNLDTRLQLQDRLKLAAGTARATGGAWLWVVLRNDRDFRAPLPPGPHEIAAVHVASRVEAIPLTWVRDLESPDYGRPETMQVTLQRDGMPAKTETVHTSRLVYIPGMPALYDQSTGSISGYDLSAVQVYYPAVRDIETAWSSGANLIQRLAMPMMRLLDVGGKAANELTWADRLRETLRSMTTRGLMVLLGTDEMSWTGPSISGYDQIHRSLSERVSAPEGIPLSRLMGQSPAGLSTDDAAGARSYSDLIARQRAVYGQALLDLYTIALGPGDRCIDWPSTERPDPEQEARVGLIEAQTLGSLVQSGIIADGEAREAIRQEGDIPLDPAYDIDPNDANENVAPPMPPVPPGQPAVPAVNQEPDGAPDGPA